MPAPEPLAPDSAEPLYKQLASRLAAEISNGSLPAGSNIPSEVQLMSAYGVSRITVRQATQLLVGNGQVTSHRGKGTFVTRAGLQQDLGTLQGFQEALRSQGVEPDTELLEFSSFEGRLDPGLPKGLNFPVRLRRRYSLEGTPFAVVEAYLPLEAAALGEARAAIAGLRHRPAVHGPAYQPSRRCHQMCQAQRAGRERTRFNGADEHSRHGKNFVQHVRPAL